MVYHEPAYYYHQKHLLFPAIYKYWQAYQKKLLDSLKDKDVVLAGDGRHDSMGHSAKYGAYTIFCCTVGLIVHLVIIQVQTYLGCRYNMYHIHNMSILQLLDVTDYKQFFILLLFSFSPTRPPAVVQWNSWDTSKHLHFYWQTQL